MRLVIAGDGDVTLVTPEAMIPYTRPVAFAHNASAGRHLAVEHWGEALNMGAVAGRAIAGEDAVGVLTYKHHEDCDSGRARIETGAPLR